MEKTYAIGSDHAGFSLKETIKKYLIEKGFEITDYGTFDTSSCHYPEFAERVADAVAQGKHPLGILVCGTGIGMSISANKVPGIRAAAASDYFGVKFTRLHNDANILCLGERITGPGAACEMAELFLKTPYEGGRHQKRVDIITEIERKHLK
ncbi:MAG: ribose 5-phosphate isomerase B [Clostridiales bacterium]|nr:ribose 5-phosphate isomerase B [Clostridiales bacterium]